MSDELLSRIENHVLWLTINRPDAGNALTPQVRDELRDRLVQASAEVGVRAVVITGAGSKHFCTGADLRVSRPIVERPDDAPEAVIGERAHLMRTGMPLLVNAVIDCDKPVIAAVNGTAAGAGSALVLASDLAIAADHARIIQVFVRRGLVPDGGTAYLLTRLVGMKKAKELVLFGDDLPAAEAERLGLVNRVVPADRLEAETKDWAERLASGPRSLVFAKRLLNRAPDGDRATSLEEEALAVELNNLTHDAQEGVASFVERRPVEFKGW